MYEQLKRDVCDANIELQRQELVVYSFGNVSGIDRSGDDPVVAIKPSGVPYRELVPEKIVLVDLQGNVIEGDLRPSSDTPTHLELYRSFADVGGICHTHSANATMWAQACLEIPCFGTTHADYFYGAVPVTKQLSDKDIKGDYESNVGRSIVERFAGIKPLEIPAVLVACHGPFSWGISPGKAVEVAVLLEQIAAIGTGTIIINPAQRAISQSLLNKHYLRKHGDSAYYGQG